MLLFDGGLGLIMFGLWIFCIIDVITTPEGDCRNLPKLLWLLIVILIPDVGSIVWLVAGRNWNGRADLPYKGNRGNAAPRAGARRASNPDDDEDFQAVLRARAEEQRRRAREAQQRDEQPPPT
jgi:Phospholipase_D-nuclease N-terminal